jgi:hypothetical protein
MQFQLLDFRGLLTNQEKERDNGADGYFLPACMALVWCSGDFLSLLISLISKQAGPAPGNRKGAMPCMPITGEARKLHGCFVPSPIWLTACARTGGSVGAVAYSLRSKKYVNLVLRGVNRILSLTKFLEDIIYIYIFN